MFKNMLKDKFKFTSKTSLEKKFHKINLIQQTNPTSRTINSTNQICLKNLKTTCNNNNNNKNLSSRETLKNQIGKIHSVEKKIIENKGLQKIGTPRKDVREIFQESMQRLSKKRSCSPSNSYKSQFLKQNLKQVKFGFLSKSKMSLQQISKISPRKSKQNLNPPKLKKKKIFNSKIFSENKFFEKVKKNDLNYFKEFFAYFQKLSKDEQKNFKFDQKDEDGSMVQHFSVWNQNLELVRFLKEQSVDFDTPNFEGITPLMISCFKNQKKSEILEFLLTFIKNINFQDKKGFTALHYAAMDKNIYKIKILLNHEKIKVNLKNNEGKTMLDLANDKQKILILLQNQFSRKTIQKPIRTSPTKKRNNIYKIIQTDIGIQTEKDIYNKNIEDFVIHSKIGKGSFGSVYLVQEKSSYKFFALKTLSKKTILENKLIEYAYSEKNILMQISHPFIIKLHYSFQNEEFLFLVMDYHPGRDLGYYLSKNNEINIFNEFSSKIYICEILLALEELHKYNVIFRDLKPENIILDCQGHVQLIDFGLSKENIYALDKGAESFCGSYAYLAPEMLKQKGHGKAIDYYSLGILLYEMVTGNPPFYSNDQQKMFDDILNANLSLPKNLNKNLADLLKKLLNKNPEKRLGCKKGFEEIKNHPWFQDIDWKNVYEKKMKPPKPDLNFVNFFEFNEIIEGKKIPEKMKQWTFVGDQLIIKFYQKNIQKNQIFNFQRQILLRESNEKSK